MTYVTIGRWLTTDETFKNAVAEAELEVYYHWPIGNCVFSEKKLRLPSRVFLFDEKYQKFSFSQQFSSPFLYFIAMRASGFSSSPFPRYEAWNQNKSQLLRPKGNILKFSMVRFCFSISSRMLKSERTTTQFLTLSNIDISLLISVKL